MGSELESESKKFLDEALRIVTKAESEGFKLRLMGAVAVEYHCPQFRHLREKMKRSFTDLDFMTYSKYRGRLKNFFVSFGYKPDTKVNAIYGYKRQIYRDNSRNLYVDIFFDELDMSHKVDFRGRLEHDSPTIPLADLLLEKMQIVQINEKDVKDTIILLREHEVGETDKETVNEKLISDVLSKDWGFYYTVTKNLNKVKETASKYSDLNQADIENVHSKIDRLLTAIEHHPKSLQWKSRAMVGTRKKWYNEVEESVREEVRIA